MNWFKTTLVAAGLAIASSASQAGTIAIPERVSFNLGAIMPDASSGPASITINPTTQADTVVDGKVQIDMTNLKYWWRNEANQSDAAARDEAATSWTFSLSHAGQTVDLGGLPSAVNAYWFMTDGFDGVTSGGEWVLTANSDYNPAAARMIMFNLAGFYDTKADPNDVPVPATAFFILMGLAGMGAASRRNKR